MTFSSADLIDALRRRRRRSLRPERPAGEFPPGWAAWFDAMRARAGAVTGATAESILAIFLAREPALPPRALAELNRWQAFNTLWRQQWHPASEDERGLRIFASVVTLVVHLFLAVFLLYLAYVRFMGNPAPASEGEDVVQVEYIGEGTPEDTGGGPPQGEATAQQVPAPAASAAKSPSPPAPRPPAQAAAQPPPAPVSPPVAAAEPSVPTPPVPTPPVAQPLQVTETPEPDQSFTLPPVRAADMPRPTLRTPDLAAPAPRLRTVDVPAPPVVPAVQPRETASARIAAPRLQQQPETVAMREIPAPLSPVEVPRVAMPTAPAPDLRAQAPSVAVRSIPTPAPPAAQPGGATAAPAASTASGAASQAPAPGSALASAAAAGTPNAPGNAPASGTAAASTGTRPGAAASGSGKTASPRPGALPSPRRGDDWGVSDRNRPGGQAGSSGLFNADGTPKLAGSQGKVGGGLPPGTITEDFAKIDRNGTWLKRPPFDYTPTDFDKFWIPNETLLEEWVRRSVKQVLIPIPGTTKTIKCSVVLLALGGACDITDPNLQDVEAEARKPPDVPFKPELQENQEALLRPAPPDPPPATTP
ncbi:MAG TPA: hypothetical protein VM619_15210 [Luteimonas sp.]|nr:hypothetical protein [Luteimonas sp.]